MTLPSSTRAADFIAIGENSLDVVAVADSALEAGSKRDLETLAFLPGGQAATAAVACSRLGWRSRYVGCVGDDPAAEQISAALSRERVDAHLFRRVGVRSRMAVVMIDRGSGQRTIFEYREAPMEIRPDDIDQALIVSGRLLLVDASSLAAATCAARVAREAGIPTMVDVDRPAAGLDELLSQIDVLVVSEHFPGAMTGVTQIGEALARLVTRFRPAVAVVTLGPDGSLARCGTREIRTPAPPVAVRDTTGAGDAFRAGFAAAWLEAGERAELERVLTFANAVAAWNCRAIGAQTGLPTRGELAGLL